VPGSPPNTQVVNLGVLERDGATPDPLDAVQVWFAQDDPALLAQVRTALAARRIQVVDTSTVSELRRALDETSAAWSLELAVLVGAAALVLAGLVLVVLCAGSWRSRSRDLAALRVNGVSRAAVSAIAVAEQVPVIGLAVLVGTACGVAGAQLALPTIPLFAIPPTVSTLDLSTTWSAVAVTATMALLLLSCLGWTLSRWVVRRSTPQRAREAL
jgi:predicted lysophospholipase L1 biosynthesis ABC-type transport system permease subunit